MKNISIPSVFPVACHTDHIGPGSIFVAIKGMHAHGVDYIPLAIERGATTLVIQEDMFIPQRLQEKIQTQRIKVVRVSNTRRVLAQLSAEALGFPAQRLRIIGVTGTKGKTTTCFLLEHILKTAGYKTALLSSVKNSILGNDFNTYLTTPQPDYLHVFFDQCVTNQIDFVIMEVAAQAMTLDRIYGITFDGTIFTNFSQEHGEFYRSMGDYFDAKYQIAQQIKPGGFQIVNADDAWCEKICTSSTITLSAQAQTASYSMNIIANDFQGLKLQIFDHADVFELSSTSLFGLFNAYNILAAAAMARRLAIRPEIIQKGVESFKGVPGRLEQYALPNGARCFIDNAHNPSSFQAVLSTLRGMTQHLIVVFGAGGDRDVAKRPVMGSIAAQACDIIILTSDNPRSEDPSDIIRDILKGITEQCRAQVIIELDRERAIKKAYALSRDKGIIALLGKGPEEYDLSRGVKRYFSERKIITSIGH